MTETLDKPSDSRLDRATHATMRTVAEISHYLDANGLPYSTNFHEETLPTPALRTEFDRAYQFKVPLPELALKKKGASTVMIFEHRHGADDNHGAVAGAITQTTAISLQPGVEVIWVQTPINTRYHAPNPQRHGKPVPLPESLRENIKALVTNQGVAVMTNMIGWEDDALSFRNGGLDSSGALHTTTAFVVNSTGNDGRFGPRGNAYPQQKHDAISHFPPLVVHVGAAAMDNQYTPGSPWHIEGYSSANAPDVLAPVAAKVKMVWSKARGPEEVTGSSGAAPFVSAALATLNRRYGPYLTREQLLYAVFATATPLKQVWPCGNKNPSTRSIDYQPNGQGLPFNPAYGGFGLVDVRKADRLLGQMVKLTQEAPERITTPIEAKATYDANDHGAVAKDKDGRYSYTLDMPAGIALKTTIAAEFKGTKHGEVSLTSPSGVKVPLVLSKLPKRFVAQTGIPYVSAVWPPSTSDVFGLATSHAWAGEPLAGTWTITSTRPIQRLEMFQHHFMERDIVKDLTLAKVNELVTAPAPDLSNAKEIPEMDRSYHPAAPIPLGRISKRGAVLHNRVAPIASHELDMGRTP